MYVLRELVVPNSLFCERKKQLGEITFKEIVAERFNLFLRKYRNRRCLECNFCSTNTPEEINLFLSHQTARPHFHAVFLKEVDDVENKVARFLWMLRTVQ